MSQLDAVLAHIDDNLDASLERLFAFLRIASISTDPAHRDECRRAAEHVRAELAGLGFTADVHATPGHPVVLGATAGRADTRVLFYGHYDVQPVDPLELWNTQPFEPQLETLADGSKLIRARGAADDKGQILTFLEAVRAWKAVTGALPVGVTVLIEGEEEVGSVNLPAFVDAHLENLRADAVLVCDTNRWDDDTPAITTGLRGLVHDEIVIRTADRDLHSGLFGGAAQNAVHVLAQVIAALREADGRIAVPGFYEGVPEVPEDVRAQWRGLGLDAQTFLGPVGLSVPAGEKDRDVIEQIQSRPAFDINGIIGGYTGEGSKTVIPAEASAKITFRLVGDQNPANVRDAFRAFVRRLIPADASVTFGSGDGAPAVSVPLDSPWLAKASRALADEWGRRPVTIGGGGSIPIIATLKHALGAEPLLVGFGLEDDRIHSPNEKYTLKSFHKGARSWARILQALAE
ncbi:MAG: M20/M25/M40 family metallo-hydrolase [Pseudochelatococcus sp.]|jgi:acetylornithine deacetylase/succinyl-diaminopimelate desuccinylase-like protein|uniref:M20/M25/M40 family metallo-hydrolase n=1 Tax=Pseudochelatococcus sp. TaxID=2020869 RepID=UPI003D947760